MMIIHSTLSAPVDRVYFPVLWMLSLICFGQRNISERGANKGPKSARSLAWRLLFGGSVL